MKDYSIVQNLVCGCCLLLMLGACVGARGSIVAETIDKPVSFTPCVFDASGTVVKASPEDVLKHFQIQKRFWAMFWRVIPLNGRVRDISEDLNREIASVRGDAVVNLTVAATGDFLWFFSSLVPIIPDYLTIDIEGDVVRLQPEVNTQ